jgi:transposase-like protein
MPKNHVVRDQEFKVAAVKRMIDCGNVSALAKELGVGRYLLYRWLSAYHRGGPEALRGPGPKLGRRRSKPPPSAPSETEGRIVELERKIAQQQLELDFFQRALRQVEALEHSAGRGKPRSTRSSK